MTQKNYKGREIDLGDLIINICNRPAMYCGYSNFGKAAAFIEGFAYANDESDELKEFSFWIGTKFGLRRNVAWFSNLEEKHPNDEDALAQLPILFAEFRNSKNE